MSESPGEQRREGGALPRVLLGMAGLIAAGALFVLSVVALRPTVYALSGDGLVYFLPHIKAHTDALLSGAWPRMFWESGAGWSPFESGQVGVLYFPHHLSNLIARLLGHPEWILDVSGWGHLLLAGVIAYKNLEGCGVSSVTQRAGWAVMLMLQPGPFMLGINWHAYAVSYPWFLWLLLWGWRLCKKEGEPSRRDFFSALLVSALFCWSAHPQMYVFGCVWLGVWILSMGGAKGPLVCGTLALAQLPNLASLLHLREVVEVVSSRFMVDRRMQALDFHEAQALDDVLSGFFVGNLSGDATLQLWVRSWEAGGMFFAPLLLPCAVLAWKHRRYGLILLFLLTTLFMARSSAPAIVSETMGMLGMRWTWKFCWFMGPTVVVSFLALWRARSIDWRHHFGVLALASLTGLVAMTGSGFNLLPLADRAAFSSVTDVMATTQTLLADKGGLEAGARIVLVGPWDIWESDDPVEGLGMIGDALWLVGYESVHSYEPLEPKRAADAHANLSVPWRGALNGDLLLKKGAVVRQRLREMGVDAIISKRPEVLYAERRIELVKNWLFMEKLSGSTPYPSGRAEGRLVALESLPGGRLRSPRLDGPPEVVGRDIVWEQREDGRWEGTPRVYQPWLIWLHLGLWGLCLLISWRWPWRSE